MADTLYTKSKLEAEENGELDKWERSHQANIRCAHDIDSLIASHTKDGKLEPDCAKEVLERWSLPRVQFVLANTMNRTGGLGFETYSRIWARSVLVPPNEDNDAFRVQTDRPLLAQFVLQTYMEYQALGMFGYEHCLEDDLNYTGMVLVLRPGRLKEDYWSVQNQLWIGETGFGCSPGARGQAVFATCLGDGERARWDRADFFGVLDAEYLPAWAEEKLAELSGSEQEQTDGPAQGGMEMG